MKEEIEVNNGWQTHCQECCICGRMYKFIVEEGKEIDYAPKDDYVCRECPGGF